MIDTVRWVACKPILSITGICLEGLQEKLIITRISSLLPLKGVRGKGYTAISASEGS